MQTSLSASTVNCIIYMAFDHLHVCMIVSLSVTDYVCTCWLSEPHTMRLYCACVCLCICLWPHAYWILNSIMCCKSFTEHVHLNCLSADWEDSMASKLLLRANLQGNLQGDLAYCPCILHSRKDEQQVFHFVWMFGGSSWTDITKKGPKLILLVAGPLSHLST